MNKPKSVAPRKAPLPATQADASTSAITQGEQFGSTGTADTSATLKRKKAYTVKPSLIGSV